MVLIGPEMGAQIRVDLRQWGYRRPEEAWEYSRRYPSRIVSVAPNGDVIAGFITRDRAGLATRELPALSFHILQFSSGGAFLSQRSFPTASWDENGVYSGVDGKLLVLTVGKLELFSANFEHLGERDLPPRSNGFIYHRVYPLSDRTAFLLYRSGGDRSIELISWQDLRGISGCPFSRDDQLLSVSERDLLALHFSRPGQPTLRSVEAARICGPTEFLYSWEGDPLKATLVADGGLLLAGVSEAVRYVVKGKVLWKDAFDRKTDVVDEHVEVDENGQIAAIAVKKFTGGSRLLDISAKLKSIRVVAYQVSSGKRILDIPVEPTPPRDSEPAVDFALSEGVN